MRRPPPAASDPILRQVRRVRWRRDLHTLQRALYLALASVAGAAALVVLLALSASAGVFAAGLCGALGAAVVAGAAIVRSTRRRWLGRRGTAGWVDAQAFLDGRLVTAVGLRQRPPTFFVPLLVQENLERLAAWPAERLVPRRVPRAALAAALGASYALALTLALAPRLEPPVPEIVRGDEPVELGTPIDGLPRRPVVAPARPARGAGAAGGHPGGAVADVSPRRPGALARLASGLQDRIRRRLWSERWGRIEMAGAEPPADAPPAGAVSGDTDAGPTAAGTGPQGAHRQTAARGPAEAPAAAGHEGASGAGTGTDPALYGSAPALRHAGTGRFALGLAADVHGPTGSPRPPSGEAPPAAADERPALAAALRADVPFHRAQVSPEHEPIVRALFRRRP
jgi:hypothetical protein